jgi:hypothetical protein
LSCLLKRLTTPHISIGCPLCKKADFLFYSIIEIFIQAVSWPFHYINMISLGKIFTKLPEVFNNICQRSSRFNDTISKLSLRLC